MTAVERLAELRGCYSRATDYDKFPRGCIAQQYAAKQSMKAVPDLLDLLDVILPHVELLRDNLWEPDRAKLDAALARFAQER